MAESHQYLPFDMNHSSVGIFWLYHGAQGEEKDILAIMRWDVELLSGNLNDYVILF